MFYKLCGGSTLKNVVIVTTMWNKDSRDIYELREKELSNRFFKAALDKGAQMARHDNTAESAHNIIRKIAKNHPVVLQIQRELVDERKDIIDTTAGDSINRELKEQIRRHQTELNNIREEVKRELEEKNRNLEERAKAEPVDLIRRLQDVIDARAADRAIFEREVLERERVERQLADLTRHIQDQTNAFAAYRASLEREVSERERVEAEYKRQLADLTRHIQDQTNAFAAYRASLEQEMTELRDRVATAVTIPPPVSPRPAPCVKVIFCSAAHDD